MSLDINTAGMEFVKTVLTLYRSAKYYREKEVLAKKLLEHSIEAGRLVTELGECTGYEGCAVAQKAMEELKRALFILSVMQADGIYSKRRTNPVTTFGESLKELLAIYIPDEPQSAPQYASPVREPAPSEQNIPKLRQDNKGRLSLPDGSKEDGGFNDIYYGTVK